MANLSPFGDFTFTSLFLLKGHTIPYLVREAIPRKNLFTFGFFPNGLDPPPPCKLKGGRGMKGDGANRKTDNKTDMATL